MKFYAKIITISIIVLGVVVCKVIQSRFWDTQRIEKSVRANVPIGSTKKFVIEWLSESGIAQEYITPKNSKMIAEDSGLKPQQLKDIVIGTTQEGYPLADLYHIDIYFFFDKNKKLTEYDFYKVWTGL